MSEKIERKIEITISLDKFMQILKEKKIIRNGEIIMGMKLIHGDKERVELSAIEFAKDDASLEGNNQEFLQTQVEDLKLEVRSFNCLKAAKCNTVKDILEYPARELLKFRNFGRASLRKINEELSRLSKEKGFMGDVSVGIWYKV